MKNFGRRRSDERRTIVLIDFDGTLAKGDSLLPFLNRLQTRRLSTARLAAFGGLDLLRSRQLNRNAAKQFLLHRCLAGRTAEDLRVLGRGYARHLADRCMLDDAMTAIELHRSNGALITLVSASLDIYLDHVRALVGLDALLCTQVEFGADGRATGRLIGTNVRGKEKVRVVERWMQTERFHRDECDVVAYGNSSADRDLLVWADRGFLRKRDRLRRTGEFERVRHGIERSPVATR